ncbi:hypothetical protein AB0M39_18820 [Streptomyces sp. NPDC051907]|uniref:terminase gpP N-terminus-related DNA-binding protein n=1 Tax=Streptomyces sp. NPDC051907 TaxID=3155284 RepID=UPI00344ABD61
MSFKPSPGVSEPAVPPFTRPQLAEARRVRAVELFEQGYVNSEIARMLREHPESVRRWKRLQARRFAWNHGKHLETHALRDHPSSLWTPRCPLISLSPHPAIVLASGTELSVPQVSAWL